MERIIREFLNIPDQIMVGYKKYDSDEYKYGFVTYQKNSRIAKESSWNSWRDADISPSEFENKPTKGFIIKNDITWWGIGWTSRQVFCRIYDPRGFAFDITPKNLIEIVQYCTCLQGGEIEGELVYSWEGSDLVLLPINSPDYLATKKMEEKRADAKISWSSLTPGTKYKFQWKSDLYYIGRLRWKFKVGWYTDEKTKVEGRYTFFDKETQALIQIINIKDILYPSPDGDKLDSAEVNAIIDKFKETASGKPDNKINKFVIMEPAEDLLEKAKRILIDKKYINSHNRYADNQIRLCSLSDNERELTVKTISVASTGELQADSTYTVIIQDNDALDTTNASGWSMISVSEAERIYKNMIPTNENSIMFEIDGSLYSAGYNGTESPYILRGANLVLAK